MKIKLLIIIFLLYSCTHNKFSGHVHDFDTNRPIKNVVVKIKGNSVNTDSIGHFEMEVNTNSNCVISLKREGYISKKLVRKPDYLTKTKIGELKNNTIYMFKNDSDFSK